MLSKRNREKLNIAMLVVGVVLMALSYQMFLIQNRIAPGGFTGVATILHVLFGWPVGTVVIVLNVPLFALGMRLLGVKFGIRSFLAMMASSLLLDILPDMTLTQDVFLASVYGGLLLGLGLGMVLAGGATTGGSDLTAMLLHHRVKSVSVGWVLFAIDALVVIASGVFIEPQMALYSMVSLFLSSRVIDLVQEGLVSAKMFFIISGKPKEIADRIMMDLDRGVTGLSGTGMYSGAERQVLMCVVQRNEIPKLKEIIAKEDPDAFVIVSEVRETMGEGFSSAISKK